MYTTKLCKCVGSTCTLLLQFVVLTFLVELKGSATDLPRGPEFLSTALSPPLLRLGYIALGGHRTKWYMY